MHGQLFIWDCCCHSACRLIFFVIIEFIDELVVEGMRYVQWYYYPMFKHLQPVPVSPQVKSEQIRLLYQQGQAIQILGILTALICVVFYWPVAPHAQLLLWLGVHVALSLQRLATTNRFNRQPPSTPEDLTRSARSYVLATFASGLLWGSLCLFFDPDWPTSYQVVLITLYTGIIAGAFNTHAAYFIAFPAFYLPPVSMLLVTALSQEKPGYSELAVLFLIYTILMYLSALRFHNRLAESLEIRFENERLAAELADSNRQLRELAEKDQLTDIANRRSLDRFLEHEWKRHYRNSQALSLLFIDVDCFKQYNDHYGHQAGDQCLIRVARLLHEHARRAGDLAARYGGEEFAVVLPETDASSARCIAEKIRHDFAALQLPHAASPILPHVTLSIGVATVVPGQPKTGEHLLLAADEALYAAKRGGRNQVVEATFSRSR